MAVSQGRDNYARMHAGFRWQVPEYFNIAQVCCGRWAQRPDAIERARKRLMDPAGLWSASMLRDLEGGGPVEADHIVGWMLGKARAYGIDDTVLALAFTHLKTYEARRAAKRLG